ncbi:hypothetical protein F511_33969 [Dorcoceras hygrometricum]|uniref:Uncharacterized protein n=1 Tax=Dorcoceras hygrometricum TaxID=472368 RepID=A0A2Z7AAR1_9LAMI|nr:hypothetical protein F511_33969 [Dorcoceras hygrometricum]
MSSIKNPLAVILDSNKFTGLNYQDWLRNLKIVLASEKLLYTLENSLRRKPLQMPVLRNWQNWKNGGMMSLRHDARCCMIASMSNELQRQFEKTEYTAGIHCENPKIQLSEIQPKKNNSTVNSDLDSQQSTHIWTVNSQLRSRKVNSALTKSTQIWRRKFRFGYVNSDFGDINSDSVT